MPPAERQADPPPHLLAGLPGQHLPLPAEVLSQLLSSAALSGQPEAQGGLWNIREGTGG